MAGIARPSDFDQVRAVLDPASSSDRAALPDEVISLPIFLGAAELEVASRDPDWATRTGDAALHLRNAVVYLTAERLLRSTRDVVSEQIGDYRYQAAPLDRSALAGTFRQLAEQELQAVLSPLGSVVSMIPRLFATAPGGRGY